jgi:VanZ family protein
VALVLYASLYPFDGWRWPGGSSLVDLLLLPWPPWLTPLDESFNLIGYVPLGLLAGLAAVRSGFSPPTAFLATVAGAALLSYGCELAQHLLPGRHPSLKDWAFNLAGAALGALLALAMQWLGWLQGWQRLRRRWFAAGSAGALALLVLWPAALLFPTPVPWGLGQVGEPLREQAQALLTDVPWAEGLLLPLSATAPLRALSPLAERVCALLGLLAPVLLAYAVSPAGWHGPSHALAWLTPAATVGAAAAALVSLLLAPLPLRWVQAMALVGLTAAVVLVSQAPTDPYFAQSVQAWEQGRFVHFHGLAQWLTWLWPYGAIGWLLLRLSRREPPA